MKSIALKLWLGMMALAAVVLILLWLFQIVFLNNFYTQMRINEIKNSGLEIIKEIGNRQEIENRLDELAYNNTLFIKCHTTIILFTFKILYKAHP